MLKCAVLLCYLSFSILNITACIVVYNLKRIQHILLCVKFQTVNIIGI